MDDATSAALVRTLLEHPEGHRWRWQDVGLLGLWLDDRHVHRLHIWDPTDNAAEPPVHDHPFDFTSTVVAGEMINTRYDEDPTGFEYRRLRYLASDEETRRTDTVRLSGEATTFTAGATYRQLAPELHSSRQVPGTVTIIRCAFGDVRELTTCDRGDTPFVSGQARPADPAEVTRLTAMALDLLD